MDHTIIDGLLARFANSTSKPGNERVTAITNRVVRDLFHTIEEFDVQPSEFWSAVNYLQELGRSGEWGLVAAGLGFEAFLDVRLDEEEAAAGLTGATPRTIEGPLYVAGAPTLDMAIDPLPKLDVDDDTGEILIVNGQVRDTAGAPVPNAIVEVWHANTRGLYSVFDTAQTPFNLRRTLIADAQGRYAFRTIMPVGYAVPPNGKTEQLLDLLGRHGNRPAHIHFFVSAHGFRKLTTQINIDGDEFLHDDFAFATREGLIPAVEHVDDAAAIHEAGLNAPFARIVFDFALNHDAAGLPNVEVDRVHAAAA